MAPKPRALNVDEIVTFGEEVPDECTLDYTHTFCLLLARL